MNRFIVVTGGTKGIGKAIVEKFASEGFDVATCARNKADLEHLKTEIEKKYAASTVYVLAADLSKISDVKNFTDYITSLARPVDILVNNAGYFEPGELSTEKEGTLEGMMNANLYSAYYTTRGLIQAMKHRKSGYVFNMCSVASFKAYPNGGSYAITKFALLGFSKCLREELMTFGIRVTSVMPGATLTASWEGVNLPEERFMKAEDVADAMFGAYSLSNRSVVEELVIRPQLGDI